MKILSYRYEDIIKFGPKVKKRRSCVGCVSDTRDAPSSTEFS